MSRAAAAIGFEAAVDRAWTAISFGCPMHVWNAYVTGDAVEGA